jgi:hypothetical protein
VPQVHHEFGERTTEASLAEFKVRGGKSKRKT